jgi:hypothetical protein
VKGASPFWNLWKDPYATFVGTDSVLLELRNRKEGCCAWSLVAITSRILALKLTASLRVLIKSLFLFEVLAWLPLIVLAYRSPQPSVLLGSNLSSSHAVPPLSKYPTWWWSTFQVMLFDLARDFKEPFCLSYQRKHCFWSLPLWLHKCHIVSDLGP